MGPTPDREPASVAILADIHAVLPALDAVLAEPDVVAADRIVLCGDIAAGPQPAAVLDRLSALGPQLSWGVRGNGDRELVRNAEEPVAQPSPLTAALSTAEWAPTQLRPDQVRLLADLPTVMVMAISGVGRVLFCHATPRDDAEVVVVDSRLDRWAAVFADVAADVTTLVCGHTHMPYARLAHGRLVVNPGSVGMPYGRPGAHWALLGGADGVQLRRTLFDREAAAASIVADSSYPEVERWCEAYVLGTPTDVDALNRFGPLDGRG